ncbi:acetylxylan esterase [Stieleria sp. TO1_6]|uniref:glucuronyl esterase domain-containing protein n=1 Tax=Stieleria tagensis TaxID=2956795 RepID=UPI00209B2B1F|nr:acetylxylan esterase [Stieleria tagensis]MCO8121874.1 acetylxylan esterase [Stieleria tagensis]
MHWSPRFSQTLVVVTLSIMTLGRGQLSNAFEPNYDESKIPDYTLPDPLVGENGSPITTPIQWNQTRREELVDLFSKHVYGVSPPACEIRNELVSQIEVFNGLGTRTEVDVLFGTAEDAPSMRLLIYVPTERTSDVPAFLGLNFQGNHTIDPDPSISMNRNWVRDRKDKTTDGNKATKAGRGVAASRWPVQMILKQGYGLVTIYYGDIDPDFDDGFKNGIHGALGSQLNDVPENERWGSIAAWAYGLSRALDYLKSSSALGINAEQVAVIGHSRLGKTSLWAGATDPRFAMVISNDSGCGGAALSRRAIGETVGRINSSFPHWFCDQFQTYNENESALPVDQHELIALVAPRPVYIASATGDQWADPKGEFLAAVHADPVYRLLATTGMGGDAPPEKMPPPDQPIADGEIGYHLRTGKHDLTEYDWQQYLNFADRHFK